MTRSAAHHFYGCFAGIGGEGYQRGCSDEVPLKQYGLKEYRAWQQKAFGQIDQPVQSARAVGMGLELGTTAVIHQSSGALPGALQGQPQTHPQSYSSIQVSNKGGHRQQVPRHPNGQHHGSSRVPVQPNRQQPPMAQPHLPPNQPPPPPPRDRKREAPRVQGKAEGTYYPVISQAPTYPQKRQAQMGQGYSPSGGGYGAQIRSESEPPPVQILKRPSTDEHRGENFSCFLPS